MKTIFISGAGGYIGSKMVETYLGLGYKVIALDRFFFGDNLADLAGPNLKIIKDDIRYFDKNILSGADAVVDLASISNDPASELAPAVTEEINYQGAVRLATLAKEMKVKKYIMSSSCSIYGHGKEILTEESPTAPISTYAKCKLAAEKDILALLGPEFCVTILRNSTVYGVSKRRMRFDLIINIMTLHAWKSRKLIIMGGGKQWRPLIHLDDLIEAFRLVAEENDLNKINGQIINIGSNDQNYQVFQVANRFRDYFSDLIIETAPDDPDPRNYHVNFDKAARVLNFKASKTIDDGIKEIREALEKGEVTDSIATRTVDYYRFLIDADKLLSSVKLLNNKLF